MKKVLDICAKFLLALGAVCGLWFIGITMYDLLVDFLPHYGDFQSMLIDKAYFVIAMILMFAGVVNKKKVYLIIGYVAAVITTIFSRLNLFTLIQRGVSYLWEAQNGFDGDSDIGIGYAIYNLILVAILTVIFVISLKNTKKEDSKNPASIITIAFAVVCCVFTIGLACTTSVNAVNAMNDYKENVIPQVQTEIVRANEFIVNNAADLVDMDKDEFAELISRELPDYKMVEDGYGDSFAPENGAVQITFSDFGISTYINSFYNPFTQNLIYEFDSVNADDISTIESAPLNSEISIFFEDGELYDEFEDEDFDDEFDVDFGENVCTLEFHFKNESIRFNYSEETGNFELY